MSDEQMPAWAQAMQDRAESRAEAMEHRLIQEISKSIVTSESRAEAMEHRLVQEISKSIVTSESRAEAMEHRLFQEISKAIATSEDRTAARITELRAEMTRRFDQVHDDLTVNLARADAAIERVQRLEGDVRKELSQLQRRLRELEHWRDHRPEAGP